MMNPVIPIVLIFAFVLPLGLLIWWKAKTGAKLRCFLAGAVCFALFAYGLENLLHQLCIYGEDPVSAAILGSPIVFMFYGSFAAGIFEETGRLFGFRLLLRRHREAECAVAYGIGHGGIEVILVLGMTYAVYFLALLGVPIGDADSTAQVVSAAGSITAALAAVGMFERISAMMLHIGLSMIMFTAVRQKGRLWLYPVCICIHALADMPACLYQYGIITSLLVIEAVVFVMGVAMLLIGAKLLKAYASREDTGDAAPESEDTESAEE